MRTPVPPPSAARDAIPDARFRKPHRTARHRSSRPMSATAILHRRSAAREARSRAAGRLHMAVQRNPLLTPGGISEYVFARLFRGLVYAQIWEDPEIDMEALAI